jgi:hypothetical protein
MTNIRPQTASHIPFRSLRNSFTTDDWKIPYPKTAVYRNPACLCARFPFVNRVLHSLTGTLIHDIVVFNFISMNKSPYDTDVTVWSPQGRLFQVEYAMEAVKQGSCVVGIRSNEYAVIAALRSRQSDFASYQQKVFAIDDHVGCAISGLTADGRVLHSFMRTECLNHRFVYEAPLNVGRLVNMISQSMQIR